MKSRLHFLLLAIMLTPRVSAAVTWRVEYDPDHSDGLIAAAVVQASAGDTILVTSGMYFEHIFLDGKTLTFRSVDGAGSTVLDGSMDPSEGVGSVLYVLGSHDVEVRVEGFTFQGGQGTPGQGSFWSLGGAIALDNPSPMASMSLSVNDCSFESNFSGPAQGSSGLGGAVYFHRAISVDINRCSFRGNRSAAFGGAIAGSSSSFTLTECSFEFGGDAAEIGGAIWLDSVDSILLDHCSFLGLGGGS